MVRFLGNWAGAFALASIMAGCAVSPMEGGFASPYPAARIHAIEQAATAGDTSAVREIIEQLDSDDPAVRFTAIGALQRLTGRTYGYHYADPPLVRREAIVRWRDAQEAGDLDDEVRQRMTADGELQGEVNG